jgi:nucleoside-diphosphate-sugar epimerase
MEGVAFVTGATGFVGSHLVDRLLADGWSVRALVRATSDTRHLRRPGVELVEGSLDQPETIARGAAGAAVVFHLAAVTAARTEAEYLRANGAGTASVLQAVRSSGPEALVYLSSYAACGPSLNGRRQMDEAPAPLTAYGRSKLEGEEIARRAEAGGVRVVIVRAPAVYGPGDRALLPYFRIIRWRLAPVPGGSHRRLDLVFAPDLAAALSGAAAAPSGTYAVAEPIAHEWGEVVETIGSVMKRRPIQIPLPASIVRSAAGITEAVGRLMGRAVPFNREKAEEMLAHGWTCDLSGSEALLPPDQFTPLSEGMDRTVRWYIRQGWL